MVFRGEHRLLLFLATCGILKVYVTLHIMYLSYIASIHNVTKDQAERLLDLLLNFVALEIFKIVVNGKIVKCATYAFQVLFGSDHLGTVWGHSVHFAKFLMLHFSKGCRSPSLHPISTKPYRKHYLGTLQSITFSGCWPKFKSIWHFEDKLLRLHCQYPRDTLVHRAKGQGPWASC